MTHSFLQLPAVATISVMLCLFFCPPAGSAEKVVVADELERLAAEHGFAVRGLEQTEEIFGRAEGKNLYPRLRLLLENFDHVIVQSPEGGVDRVIVLGEKVPFEPPPPPIPADESQPDVADGGDIVMETERRGTQHLVRVSLEGTGGTKIPRELLVDTGADFLVLPQSLVSKLGLKASDLRSREMQTANGKIKGRVGILPAMWLGEKRITDVDTAFIEDGKLGGNGLLGMSVLGRYKMTMDDSNNKITLGGKDGVKPPTEETEGGPGGEEATEEEAAPSDPGGKTP